MYKTSLNSGCMFSQDGRPMYPCAERVGFSLVLEAKHDWTLLGAEVVREPGMSGIRVKGFCNTNSEVPGAGRHVLLRKALAHQSESQARYKPV